MPVLTVPVVGMPVVGMLVVAVPVVAVPVVGGGGGRCWSAGSPNTCSRSTDRPERSAPERTALPVTRDSSTGVRGTTSRRSSAATRSHSRLPPAWLISPDSSTSSGSSTDTMPAMPVAIRRARSPRNSRPATPSVSARRTAP